LGFNNLIIFFRLTLTGGDYFLGYDQETYMNSGDGLGVLGFFVDVGELIMKIAKHLLEPKSTFDMNYHRYFMGYKL